MKSYTLQWLDFLGAFFVPFDLVFKISTMTITYCKFRFHKCIYFLSVVLAQHLGLLHMTSCNRRPLARTLAF